VGTEKRERQKANRALRMQQEEQAEKRSRLGRIALYLGIAVAGILILVVAVNLLAGDDDSGDTAESADAADQPVTEDESSTADDDAAADEPGEPGAEVIPEDCPPAEGTGEQQQEFDEAPPSCLDPAVEYSAEVSTNLGEFTIALDQEKAPNTVNNFVYLARHHYFDATECHRIIEGFVVQCGDPTGSGSGGPGYQFEDELPEAGEYQLGSVAMANSGPDTNGSQFFIVTGEDGAALQPDYSLFGQVTSGFDDTVAAMEAAGAAGELVEITEVVIITS
jgi:cyclophilin family peptidyl-prolyl cis-trans isomerase